VAGAGHDGGCGALSNLAIAPARRRPPKITAAPQCISRDPSALRPSSANPREQHQYARNEFAERHGWAVYPALTPIAQ